MDQYCIYADESLVSFCTQKAEIKAILEMLPKYYTFMKKNAKRSLLTRFCGLYSVKLCDAEVDGR